MKPEEIEKYRASLERKDNEKLLKEFLKVKGNRWTKCLCNVNNRIKFNTKFFEWYDSNNK